MNKDNNFEIREERLQELIRSYFEGTTTLGEENLLRCYFDQEKTDRKFDPVKPLFRYFSEERQTQAEKEKTEEKEDTRQIALPVAKGGKEWIRWISVAAACLLLPLVITIFFTGKDFPGETSIAYINGKKETGKEIIRLQALASLENLDRTEDEIISTQLEMLNSFDDLPD